MKRKTMNRRMALDKQYQAITWGVGLVWVGILNIIPGEQNGIGLLGIGLMLLSLNLWRSVNKIPLNTFTTIIGVVISIMGLAELLRPLLNLPHFELDLIPILLIVIGLYILIPDPEPMQEG